MVLINITVFSCCSLHADIYILGSRVGKFDLWRNFWLGFIAVFCFLSMDEALGIHEMISSIHNINWIWLYAPPGAIFFIISGYFLEYLNKNMDLTNHILGGLTTYALAILVSEIFNSYIELERIKTTIEEGLEMFGSLIVLTGCIKEVNRLLKELRDYRQIEKMNIPFLHV